jgi:hypothetical protein
MAVPILWRFPSCGGSHSAPVPTQCRFPSCGSSHSVLFSPNAIVNFGKLWENANRATLWNQLHYRKAADVSRSETSLLLCHSCKTTASSSAKRLWSGLCWHASMYTGCTKATRVPGTASISTRSGSSSFLWIAEIARACVLPSNIIVVTCMEARESNPDTP